MIQLAVDDWALENLMTFDAEAAELEPEPDDAEDGLPVVIDLVPPKMVRRRRAPASGCVARAYGTQGDDPAQSAWPGRQSIPLDEADIECLIDGLRLVTPCTQRIDA